MTIVLVTSALLVGFALGAFCGFGAYHLGRMTNKYLPVYKGIDHEKTRNQALQAALKAQQEVADMQRAYLSGIKLDKEGYLAGEKRS